mmetsp:Transcript_484/g.547  ORF Transcript_484/g.547 Transcript_484/m.547 type:complete len:319 (-) Transcript_484:585-1541(-)
MVVPLLRNTCPPENQEVLLIKVMVVVLLRLHLFQAILLILRTRWILISQPLAADPSSPLPPYMSPASLEDASVRSANLPPSPNNGGGGGAHGSQQQQRPDFRPHMSSSRQTPSPSYAEPEQVNSIGLAPPAPTGGLVFAQNAPPVAAAASEELVGRLDQVLSQQQQFSTRLDGVEQRMDQSAIEQEQRTKTLLESFRDDSKKTQDTFMKRINNDIRGMRTTIDNVLVEQRTLKQTQETQALSLKEMEASRLNMKEHLVTLEKTTSIRAQNLEQSQSQSQRNQEQKMESLMTKLNTEREAFLKGQQQAQQAQQQQQQQQ